MPHIAREKQSVAGVEVLFYLVCFEKREVERPGPRVAVHAKLLPLCPSKRNIVLPLGEHLVEQSPLLNPPMRAPHILRHPDKPSALRSLFDRRQRDPKGIRGYIRPNEAEAPPTKVPFFSLLVRREFEREQIRDHLMRTDKATEGLYKRVRLTEISHDLRWWPIAICQSLKRSPAFLVGRDSQRRRRRFQHPKSFGCKKLLEKDHSFPLHLINVPISQVKGANQCSHSSSPSRISRSIKLFRRRFQNERNTRSSVSCISD